MKKMTEELKTDIPDLPVLHCEVCEQDSSGTPHKIIVSHITRTEFEEDLLETAMQIIRCEICHTESFRELSAIRGFHEENSEGIWVDPVTEVRYHRTESATVTRFSADKSTGIFD